MAAFGEMDAASRRFRGAFAAIVAIGVGAWALTPIAEPEGRAFILLGFARIVVFFALWAVASLAAGEQSKLMTTGLYLAFVGALANALGAIGAVVTDGLEYNPFETAANVEPPWYAYVIGLSAFVFALGALLVGIAAWRAGVKRAGLAAILGGAIYPVAFIAVGHAIWALPWLALGVLVYMDSRDAGPAIGG